MHHIADSKLALSKAGWVGEIDKKFGASARFHTCSAQNMTAEVLLDFLSARGKFTGTDEAMALEASAICNH